MINKLSKDVKNNVLNTPQNQRIVNNKKILEWIKHQEQKLILINVYHHLVMNPTELVLVGHLFKDIDLSDINKFWANKYENTEINDLLVALNFDKIIPNKTLRTVKEIFTDEAKLVLYFELLNYVGTVKKGFEVDKKLVNKFKDIDFEVHTTFEFFTHTQKDWLKKYNFKKSELKKYNVGKNGILLYSTSNIFTLWTVLLYMYGDMSKDLDQWELGLSEKVVSFLRDQS